MPPNPTPAPLLHLYTFDRSPKTYSFPPFAIKLRLRLRHGALPYEDQMGNFVDPPKKKIPYVKFLDTGEFMGDPGLVIERLCAEGRLADVNAGLSPEVRSRDVCLRALLEDRLYFLVLYERWYIAYPTMRDHGPFSHLPWGQRHVVNHFLYRYASILLYCQGMGRYSKEEASRLIEECIETLNGFAEASLAKAGKGSDGPFWILGGSEPTEADFSLYGNVASLVTTVVNPLMAKTIKEKPSLVEYFKRIHNKYFPEVDCPF